ncbi:MAG: hypothetical protein ACYCZE_04455 [Thiobacillus sp.]
MRVLSHRVSWISSTRVPIGLEKTSRARPIPFTIQTPIQVRVKRSGLDWLSQAIRNVKA